MEEMKTTAADEQETEIKTAEVKTDKTEKKKTKKSEAELAACRKELEEQTEKCKEYEDRYLRMMAEYDNFRKRSAKEKEGVWADAYADCIANLLPILDNLERAEKCDNLEGLKKGLEMTSKAFDDALSKMGITEIETKTFDPNLHNAVMHTEDENFGENVICQVFQKGFKLGDKIVRFAMVQVAN